MRRRQSRAGHDEQTARGAIEQPHAPVAIKPATDAGTRMGVGAHRQQVHHQPGQRQYHELRQLRLGHVDEVGKQRAEEQQVLGVADPDTEALAAQLPTRGSGAHLPVFPHDIEHHRLGWRPPGLNAQIDEIERPDDLQHQKSRLGGRQCRAEAQRRQGHQHQ